MFVILLEISIAAHCVQYASFLAKNGWMRLRVLGVWLRAYFLFGVRRELHVRSYWGFRKKKTITATPEMVNKCFDWLSSQDE